MPPSPHPPQDDQQIYIPAGESSLYGQFCPVAMAAELLATRWTLVLLGEMLSGSTRFNDIRRGVPRMSSALLSKRLRELEKAGVLTHSDGEYVLTPSGRDLSSVVQAMGRWALRWVDTDCTLANLDPRLLMWNIRRNLRPDPMPNRRVVIEFQFHEMPAYDSNACDNHYWLIVEPGTPVDLCSIDPGGEIDLLVTAELRALTSAWMGMSDFAAELRSKRIKLDGDPTLSAGFKQWIGRSGLATTAGA